MNNDLGELNSNLGKDDEGMTIHEKLDKILENGIEDASTYVLALTSFSIDHNNQTKTIDVSKYNNGMDITKATIYPLFKYMGYNFNNAGQTGFSYAISATSDWKIKYESNGYQSGVSIGFNFYGFVILWD